MRAFWASLVVLFVAAPALAQGFPGAQEYAEAVVELTTPKWEGQVVDWPEPRPRPLPDGYVARSDRWPLAVHAPVDMAPARAREVLTALEGARALLDEAGWPDPWPDGGRGGTGGFDLYLAPAGETGVDAFADAPVAWSFWDGVSSYAVLDPRVARGALEACVTSAYVQAALLGQAPAEARSWRQATGAFVAWLATGDFGCGGGVVSQQREPWQPWIDAGAPDHDPEGGALLLAMLSARHDGGSGVFVRELWQLARQRSSGIAGLRGSPDLWQALHTVLEVAQKHADTQDPLESTVEDLAVERYFAGARENGATPWYLRGLGPEATVPVQFHARWSALPRHTEPASPPLCPYGSAYALVDVGDAPDRDDDAVLRVWLRGEYGVRWSLVAVRLDAEGRELERVSAPARKIPRSYVPVQLDRETARVLVVVTNMSSRLPDADVPDENVRSFHLIFDRGTPATALGKGG